MTNQVEYRFYTFTNFYLNSVAQGIQPMHVQGEATIKYILGNKIVKGEQPYAGQGRACRTFTEWLTNHKTVISLNGGDYRGVTGIYAKLEKLYDHLHLPYAAFLEEEGAIAEMATMTSCGIVVPNTLYEAVTTKQAEEHFHMALPAGNYFYIHPDQFDYTMYEENSPEWELIRLLKSCPLAR